jgi:hypothetical protein
LFGTKHQAKGGRFFITMAKDPAILFYTDNFLSGTMFFTDDQTGKYIRALCAQHQHGHLTKQQIDSIVKNDLEVMNKFKKDTSEKFYNERMETEINRRLKYTDSRRKNIGERWGKNDKPLSGKKIDLIHMDIHNSPHMYNHMGNGNGNEIKDINDTEKEGMQGEKKKFVPPTFEEVEKYCKENKHHGIAKRAFDGYATANWHDSQGKQIKSWRQKFQHVWFRDDNLDPLSAEEQEQIKRQKNAENNRRLLAEIEEEKKLNGNI